MRPTDWLLFAGVMVSCYVFICLWTFLTTIAKRRQLKEIAFNLNGSVKNSLTAEPTLELNFHGFPVRAYVTCPTKYAGSFLYVVFSHDSVLKVNIIPKKPFSLLNWRTPLVVDRKIATGFADLDQKLVFYGGKETLVQSFVQNESVRAALIYLFDAGWTKLEFNKKKIQLSQELNINKTFGFSWEPSDALVESAMKKTLEAMAVLAKL